MVFSFSETHYSIIPLFYYSMNGAKAKNANIHFNPGKK